MDTTYARVPATTGYDPVLRHVMTGREYASSVSSGSCYFELPKIKEVRGGSPGAEEDTFVHIPEFTGWESAFKRNFWAA